MTVVTGDNQKQEEDNFEDLFEEDEERESDVEPAGAKPKKKTDNTKRRAQALKNLEKARKIRLQRIKEEKKKKLVKVEISDSDSESDSEPPTPKQANKKKTEKKIHKRLDHIESIMEKLARARNRRPRKTIEVVVPKDDKVEDSRVSSFKRKLLDI